MKDLNNFLVNKQIERHYDYTSETKEALISIIKKRIKKEGDKCNLNDIDVSKITDMSSLFRKSSFNDNVSEWNVSNVINMDSMFEDSDFNNDISDWNVHNVKSMHCMFSGSKFNKACQPLKDALGYSSINKKRDICSFSS